MTLLLTLWNYLRGLLSPRKDEAMFSGLMPLLRAFGVPGLDALKQLGLKALKSALKEALKSQRAHLAVEALKRLTADGAVTRLPQAGPFSDLDGVAMNGRQKFVHDALWALPRVIMGGAPADAIRDDHFASWGLTEADALLSGITDGRVAVEKVLDRLIEQLT